MFIGTDIFNLLPAKTVKYINNVSAFTKIKTLKTKLKLK